MDLDFQKYKLSDNHMKIKVLFHFFFQVRNPQCQSAKKRLKPKGFCLKST